MGRVVAGGTTEIIAFGASDDSPAETAVVTVVPDVDDIRRVLPEALLFFGPGNNWDALLGDCVDAFSTIGEVDPTDTVDVT